jgi:predicted Zn-ribbon and HTH transcriptional regulator
MKKAISPTYNLLSKFPILSLQWHPTLNKNLKPEQFTHGSECSIWWICEFGHEWQATICNRTLAKSGCPYCKSRKVGNDNNFAIKNPNLLLEWDWKENNKMGLNPYKLLPKSHVKVNWICIQCNNKWLSTLANRVTKNSGCPKCRDVLRRGIYSPSWIDGRSYKRYPQEFSCSIKKKN